MGVRPLCVDKTPAVRAAFHAALARWITAKGRHALGAAAELEADGAEDVEMSIEGAKAAASAAVVAAEAATPPPEGCALRHAPYLLPFLLTGVADETAANGVAALALVEEVGLANDDALGVSGADAEAESAEGAAAVVAAALPAPFSGAPAASARRLVRSLLPNLMPMVLGEVREWTAAQRNGGARLLGTTLAFAQATAGSHTRLPPRTVLSSSYPITTPTL